MIANLLDEIEVRLSTDYLENKAELDALADKVVYTGPIDAYFDYSWVRWNTVLLDLRRKLWINQISRQCRSELYRPRNSVDPYH